ncbi:MAG: radical SAM protein [Candidatus Omnitrophica bacterium]|nr:radical SAM protein [Candidatus Omnitrophota bacterium]
MFNKNLEKFTQIEKAEFASMGITDKCMLKCKMCYKWQPDIFIKSEQADLAPTLEQYQDLIKGLKQIVSDDFVLNFGGGEALLHPDIYELISCADKAGMRTNLVSNGYLIDKKVAKKLAGSGLKTIKLSLDSMNEKKHDYLRGVAGVYNQLMRAIDNLDVHAPNIEMALISVIYEQNYSGIIDLVEWVNNNPKIKDVSLTVAMQPNNTLPEKKWWNGEYGFLWPKNKKAISVILDQLIELKSNNYKINNSIAQLKAMKKYLINPEDFVKKTNCNMDKAIHISSIGKIYHCFFFDPIGDIHQSTNISNIWNSEKARMIRQDIRNCKQNCHFLINCFFEEDE